MKSIVIFCSLIVAIQAVSFHDLIAEEWKLFKTQFSKKYDSEIEENFRMKIFMENKHKIARHNQLYASNEVSFELKMNHFGDLLSHEYARMVNGFRHNTTTDSEGVTFIPPYNYTAPDVVDWRQRGAVTPVKNQGECGSCWAFSSTGALEGQHFRKTGTLVSLSEQNLIDCSKKYGNNGCQGGLMDNAFKYVKENNGIDSEEAYPYEAENDKCRYNPATSKATDKGFVDIPKGDEKKLAIAVASVGPVSVAIDASHESFQFYSNGVYHEKRCSSEQLDHGVLVVGYGTTEKKEDYWLVKNSWGPHWGSTGYIKMARNKKNNCGIASSASYPLV